MWFRPFIILGLLAILLCGCVTTGDDDPLDRMQRNHRDAVETAA
jgi:hypothetical protein